MTMHAWFSAVAFCLVAPLFAETLSPVAYSGTNGEIGPNGELHQDNLYSGRGDRNRSREALSDGLGQLSDGMTGCGDDPRADCGRGPGFEWVGWRSDVTLIFTFGPRYDFRLIRVFTANPAGNAGLWKSATVSFSEDGLTFREYVIRTSTPEERRDQSARYLEIPVNGTGRFVRVHLARADDAPWLLISEIAFEGETAVHQHSQ